MAPRKMPKRLSPQTTTRHICPSWCFTATATARPTTRHGEQLLLGPTNPVTAARTWLVTQLQLFMACPGRKTQTIQTRYVQSAMGCGAMSILSTQLLIPCTHETVWHPAQHTKCPKSSDDDTPYLSCMVIHSHSSPTPSAQRCCLSDLFTAVCM